MSVFKEFFTHKMNHRGLRRAFLLLFLPLISCTPSKELSHEEKQMNNEGAAQFIVVSEGYEVTPQPQTIIEEDKKTGRINDHWRMERFRNYNFKVCLNDRNESRKLRNQKFSVNSFQGLKEDFTGDDGCFRWVETIEYNYFANATYVLLERKLTGRGSYRGVFHLKIAVNPWAERDHTREKEVVFLKPNRGSVSEKVLVKGDQDIRKALFGEEQPKKPLFLENLSVQLTEEGIKNEAPNRFLLWLRNGTLQVKVTNIKKEDRLIPIKNGGHFRVFSRLLQHSSSNGRLDSLDEAHTGAAPSVVLNSQGRIPHLHHRQTTPNELIHMQIPKKMSRNWDAENGWLVLRVQALDFPFGDFFEQLNVIYDIGRLTSLTRGSKAQKRPIQSEKYAKVDKKGFSGFDKFFASLEVKDKKFIGFSTHFSPLSNTFLPPTTSSFKKYDFSKMAPRFEEVAPGESVTTRGIRFRTRTCLTKKTDGTRPPLGAKFQVTVSSKTSKRKNVYDLEIKENNRCLSFVHEFFYKQFKPETLFFFDLEIKELASNTVVGNEAIAINPWDPTWTFGRDKRELDADYIKEVEEMEKIQSRFFLTQFKYFTLRFRYAIDKFLNLKVKKSILLYLDPAMMRYNSREKGRFGIFRLRDGIYLMKVALEKQYLDPSTPGTIARSDNPLGGRSHELIHNGDLRKKHHITIVKKLVRVIDGMIIEPVELTVTDLRIMRIRAQMMIQLEPVEEWRHFVVKLYNEFYERQIKEVKAENPLLNFQAFEDLNEEKIKNIRKIIKAMSENERMVHWLIEDKYNEYKKHRTPYEFKGKFYEGCYGVPKLTWDNIFELFDLSHPQLESMISHNPSQRDQELRDDSDLHTTSKGKKCYIPYNVVQPIIINDFMNVQLNSIPGLDLNEFIDTPESSGLQRETFFGPVTLLLNGNGSNMRPTRNISEYACIANDCDQFKAQKNFKNIKENWELLRDPENQKLQRVYDHSPFFHSVRYLNNIHVDHLIPQMKEQQRKYNVMEGARSQLYYYLRQYNFNLLSMGDEELYQVNEPQCEGKWSTLQTIEPCLEKVDDQKVAWEDFAGEEENIKKDVEELVNSLKVSKPLAQRICEYFVKRLDQFAQNGASEENKTLDLSRGESVSGHPSRRQTLSEDSEEVASEKTLEAEATNKAEGESEEPQKSEGLISRVSKVTNRFKNFFVSPTPNKDWVVQCMNQFRLTAEQMDKCEQRHLDKESRIQCESRERTRNREGLLNIERKIRVKKTGRYFSKGGKSQNLNVGNQFGLNHSQNFSDSWSGGYGMNAGQFLSRYNVPMPTIGADYKISSSESNTVSDGTSVNEQTFLVMQDAVMDIELLEYIKCTSIYINPRILNSQRSFALNYQNKMNHVIAQKINSQLKEGLITESEKDEKKKEYELELTRGLFICDDANKKETPQQPLAIREHYYYFTQHFTEGDMLDPADLYNHPWLIAIRGKTDVWRFLDRIKAQNATLSNNFQPFGPVVKGHGWPIQQLVSAYSGVIPSFPGIYTLLHNEYEYAADFPWSDQPSHSFQKRFLESFSGINILNTKEKPHFMDQPVIERHRPNYTKIQQNIHIGTTRDPHFDTADDEDISLEASFQVEATRISDLGKPVPGAPPQHKLLMPYEEPRTFSQSFSNRGGFVASSTMEQIDLEHLSHQSETCAGEYTTLMGPCKEKEDTP